jgi:large subunit ribosomal protein L5
MPDSDPTAANGSTPEAAESETTESGSNEQPAEQEATPEAPAPARRRRQRATAAAAPEAAESESSEQPAEQESTPEAPAPARRQRQRATAAAAPEAAESGGSEQVAEQESAPEAAESGSSEEPAGQESATEVQAPARRQRAPRTRRAATAVEEPPEVAGAPPSPRLLGTYRSEIVPAMMSEFGYSNTMRVPRLQKITLNIGLGEALTNGRAMEAATQDLATISGQKPIITRARKSIANFKLREGNPIGTAVTLRGARMYHFLDRLVNTALPRIRDFRGISRRGFDGRGNFSIGIREQIIFPEIDYNQIDRIRGLQVTINTTASNDAEGIRLLELFGMPFVRQD